MTLPEAPSGCAHCGVDRTAHPWLWTAAAGLHQYVGPSQDQILTRMRKRRTTKETP